MANPNQDAFNDHMAKYKNTWPSEKRIKWLKEGKKILNLPKA